MSTTYFKTKQAGFSLVETLIYLTLMVFFFAVIVNNLIVITRTHRGLAVLREMEQSAITGLDRLTREIRAAAIILSAQSTLGSHPGVLTLSVRDDSTGNYDTVRFSLDDGALVLTKNSVVQGDLTSTKISVTNLIFTEISAASSTAVKIEMQLQATSSDEVKTENFYHTVILRESYFDM